MRTFISISSRLVALSLLAVPVWAQTAPAPTTPAATPAPAAPAAAPAATTVPAAPATPAAPAASAPVATTTPVAPATAPAPAAPAPAAPQSQFTLVLITPGGNPPSTITESTPSSIAWNMYPSTTGLIDPGAAFSSRLSQAYLIRLASPTIVGAPIIYGGSTPTGVYANQYGAFVTPPAPRVSSPYRFSSGW